MVSSTILLIGLGLVILLIVAYTSGHFSGTAVPFFNKRAATSAPDKPKKEQDELASNIRQLAASINAWR